MDRYSSACSVGVLEQNSLDTIKMNLRHVIASFGKEFAIEAVKLADLQRHVERRAKKKGIHGRPLSPATIRKEITTLRAAWNWCVQAGMIAGAFPNIGLKYPKTSEKPPFQTWDEIKRQIRLGNLAPTDQRRLWESLYMTPA